MQGQGPYGQPNYPQYPQQQQQQHQQQQQAPAQNHFGLPGVGRLPFGGGPNLAGVKQPSGLPAPLAFGLGIAAIVVALVFDVIFLKVHIPGVGGYAWYLTTALSFAGAGYGGMKWTKAGKTMTGAAVVMAGVLYGAADLGLGIAMEDLTMGSAIVLAAQGIAIALVCGFGGLAKAVRETPPTT